MWTDLNTNKRDTNQRYGNVNSVKKKIQQPYLNLIP
jgi:hypothetical protein